MVRWSSGDYQIAPKPPGGRLWLVAANAAGIWGNLSPCGSVRGSDRPPACHSIPRPPKGEGLRGCATRGEGLGDKKKRPGALLLVLFISFWWCRSGRSETGATGRRRGLRRGRRSWGPRWAAPRAGRSSSRRFGVFPPTWPADAGDASPAY